MFFFDEDHQNGMFCIVLPVFILKGANYLDVIGRGLLLFSRNLRSLLLGLSYLREEPRKVVLLC